MSFMPQYGPFFAPVVVALTDGATITPNAFNGNICTVTIAGSRTIANPLNPTPGQQLIYAITQGAGGSHTITWDTQYAFGTNGAPTLTTVAGKTDYLGFIFDSASTQWRMLGFQLGF